MIDDKASKLTRIDERLCCPGCGEFGKVLPLDDGRFLVTCKPLLPDSAPQYQRTRNRSLGNPMAGGVILIEDPKPLSKLDEAIIVAVQAHAGEVDKVGEIYIFHPLRVMLILGSAASEEQRIMAVLHDIVENSTVTLEVVGIQFGARIQEAVDAIT